MYEGLSCPLGRLENVVFPCLWSWPGSVIKSHMACDLVSLGEMGKGHVLHGACLLSLLPSLEPLSTYISLSLDYETRPGLLCVPRVREIKLARQSVDRSRAKWVG